MASLGLVGTEPGPNGYLPLDLEALQAVLGARGRRLLGGVVLLFLQWVPRPGEILAEISSASIITQLADRGFRGSHVPEQDTVLSADLTGFERPVANPRASPAFLPRASGHPKITS